MARRSKTHVIDDPASRDHGRRFLLTEMDAYSGERWAIRAVLALAKSGAEMPADASTAGWAGLASVGMKALTGLSFEDAEPLLAEMLRCVQIQPDPARPEFVRALLPDDIEEIKTMLQLRMEVFKLHVSFS
jgi:hypothetical protein